MGRANVLSSRTYLQEKIIRAEQKKQELKNFIFELNARLNRKEISEVEFNATLERELQGKSIQYWENYYNEYIRNCRELIEKEKDEQERHKKIFIFSAVIFCLGLIAGIIATSYFLINEKAQTIEVSPSYEPSLIKTVTGFFTKVFWLTGRGIEESSSEPAPPEFSTSESSSESVFAESSSLSEINTEQDTGEVSPSQPAPVSENLTEDIDEINPEVNEINLTEPEIITSENISLAENITLIENITALNETGEVQTEPIQEINITNATAINETILNETLIVTNLTANITLQETTIQYGAVIGKPVKWQKKIKIESSSDQPSNEKINIELPNLAGKISVKKIDAETGQETEITDNADIKNEKIIEVESAGSGGITGNTISTENLDSNNNVFDFFKNIFANIFRFTGKIIDNMEGSAQENVSVSINESLSQNDEIVVEYYTDAPYAEEKLLSDSSKQVVIVGPDEVHYEDVLAYSELPEEVASANKIKLYWINNSTGKREIANFEAQDSDGNGLLDIIQWTVPSLSNQTYEIILITKALHLDENKTFISDIYDSVKTKDNNWSEIIGNGEYVRVTFEKNLTLENDITIYARSAGNDSVSIEIYTENGTEIIASIVDIAGEETYKTLLSNLQGSADTFDLRIIGNLEVDWIVDPNTAPNITDVTLTTTNPATNDTNQNLTANVSASDADGDNITFAYNWYKNNVLNATTLITEGLVAYWPLNNDSLDYFGANDGTNSGATLNNSGGKIGGAYKFDGVDDYIDVSSNSSLKPVNLTFSTWIKFDS